MTWPDKNPLLTYLHSLRSRYGETDQMGYVYYARYLEYFEVARTEMIRSLGVTYRELEEAGYMLPVTEVQINYRAPIFYDDLMNIEVTFFDMPMVKLETFYQITTENNDDVSVTGKVTLCFMDSKTRKPCRAPVFFLNQIKEHHLQQQNHNLG